ncbi:MAG: T9SS type A sorting domain-containing protein [Calditrichales bacterium]|nr:MAG: T9SS type A sorting domain-containing protein [Calditrichales bacterium]
MRYETRYRILLCTLFTFAILATNGWSQSRESRIHDRGMLHETMFNTGTIGRPYQYGNAGNQTTDPLMEWPPRSRTVIDGIEYSGQHNSVGSGVYVSANLLGKPGRENRIYALCGGTGTNLPELPLGRWSFPISMEEIENFPILADGTINQNYKPDEAEEIIISKWSTPTGITVTRTSRAWSYPDYDDMIIYEYEFEYTGDTDGNLATIEQDSTLTDVLFGFLFGFAPSMLGYQRWYSGTWSVDQFSRGDAMGFYDPDYWMGFDMVLRTGAQDEATKYLYAHPDPNPDNFKLYAESGLNGGGLMSPQAPGYCMLYYDTEHLAIVDPNDPLRNQSEKVSYLSYDEANNPYELDSQGRVLQPWSINSPTANTRSSKMMDRATNIDERWGGIWSPAYITTNGDPSDEGYFPPAGNDWLGRGNFGYSSAWNGALILTSFGPYVMNIGDKIEFALAEVVGYGASAGKTLMGGQSLELWAPAPSWNRKVVISGETMTEAYLDDYGYPDYINSEVKTVNQVAHKAFEAYLGRTIPFDPVRQGPVEGVMWPENNPSPSQSTEKYKIPVPVPAPAISVDNSPKATVVISWNHSSETFTHPRISGSLVKYNLYRSTYGMGPWTLMTTIDAQPGEERYLHEDADESFRLGETKYYAVTAVDNNGIESGKTNITVHQKNVKSVDKMGKVHVVPNPFSVSSGFEGLGQEGAVGFYGLPAKCTIRIFSYAGQLVETIEHDRAVFSTAWFQVTRNRQDIASGVYLYVITTPEGDQTTGKFIIAK